MFFSISEPYKLPQIAEFTVGNSKNRSSHQRCSMEKCVLRNFTKFTGKHLCQSFFFNKVDDCFFNICYYFLLLCVFTLDV